jgi:transposase
VFFTVADLLSLSVDILFFDTTSTYFETAEADAPGPGAPKGFRSFGHSKDHRPDRPQVVLGMAVTREGIPVRLWVWPGTTQDQTVVAEVKRDLAGWELNRVVWVVDSGFNSADNRREWSAGGSSSYIVAERLRGAEHDVVAARSRQGRYHRVDDNLEVKEVWVGQGATAQRFVICRNQEVAARDAAVRAQLITQLEAEIAGSDALSATKRAELAGRLKAMPGYNRLLRATPTGRLRIDRTAARRDAQLDGKFLVRTDDERLTPTDIAQGYKALYEVERGWRDFKHTLDLRPVYHRRAERITAHAQLCWLGLLLIRYAETRTGR